MRETLKQVTLSKAIATLQEMQFPSGFEPYIEVQINNRNGTWTCMPVEEIVHKGSVRFVIPEPYSNDLKSGKWTVGQLIKELSKYPDDTTIEKLSLTINSFPTTFVSTTKKPPEVTPELTKDMMSIFHTLWAQATVGQTNYKKDEWRALQLILEKICNI